MTSLSTTDHSYDMLSHILERSSKLTQRHLHKHLEAGLELDDWSETLEDFRELTQRYNSNDGNTSSDSSDED